MRLFIGIDFDDTVKREIREIQERLTKHAARGRWKYIDNFHLTLKFLGDTREQSLAQIYELLEKVTGDLKPFQLNFNSIGKFAGPDCYRTVWLGVSGQVDALRQLHGIIDDELAKLGFKKENREYRPHITLGQDVVFNTTFNDVIQEAMSKNMTCVDVNSVVLFKSEQISGKRIYTPLKRYFL